MPPGTGTFTLHRAGSQDSGVPPVPQGILQKPAEFKPAPRYPPGHRNGERKGATSLQNDSKIHENTTRGFLFPKTADMRSARACEVQTHFLSCYSDTLSTKMLSGRVLHKRTPKATKQKTARVTKRSPKASPMDPKIEQKSTLDPQVIPNGPQSDSQGAPRPQKSSQEDPKILQDERPDLPKSSSWTPATPNDSKISPRPYKIDPRSPKTAPRDPQMEVFN